MTPEQRDDLMADGFIVLGIAFVGYGCALVSLALAFIVVGVLMLALVTVPRFVLLWRETDDRE